MYHCHILEHEDMMGQFVVIE
ncbi:MAG: hypothetical protein L3J70_09965 [Gammaproteobacteria bacterium]|nr:hypothetical protein [Gammaproteobacteria bacterium]